MSLYLVKVQIGDVVVQFYPWFNFDFPLFFSMLIYDNEYQTKKNQNCTKDKIELQQRHLNLRKETSHVERLGWLLSAISKKFNF